MEKNQKNPVTYKSMRCLVFRTGRTYVSDPGVGITSDTSPPSVYSATEDFFGGFLGLSCNSCYFLS